VHLRAICEFYGDRTTRRSGVALVRHILDGLTVLDALGATLSAQRAYCLHPMLQADDDLAQFVAAGRHIDVDAYALVLSLEYRRCANAHLSMHPVETLDAVSLMPFAEIADMLIADKVQNRRDFDRHHADSHPRAAALDAYFKRWLRKLNVDEERYASLASILDRHKA
jgi:hypothetical protein